MQQPQHLVEIGQHMRLGAAQRRKPQPGQLFLQFTQIDAAQTQVMNKIARTGAMLCQHRVQATLQLLLKRQHRTTQQPQLVDQCQAGLLVPWRRHVMGRLGGCGRADGGFFAHGHATVIRLIYDQLMKSELLRRNRATLLRAKFVLHQKNGILLPTSRR